LPVAWSTISIPSRALVSVTVQLPEVKSTLVGRPDRSAAVRLQVIVLVPTPATVSVTVQMTPRPPAVQEIDGPAAYAGAAPAIDTIVPMVMAAAIAASLLSVRIDTSDEGHGLIVISMSLCVDHR